MEAEPIMKQQDKIRVINDPVAAVRQTPDVYIGNIGNAGFKHQIVEIVQNSLDQIAKGFSVDKNVIVSYDTRNHIVIVEDFGQGIPLDVLVDAFGVLHSSSNYDKVDGSGNYSSGKNGAGATVTNYLSRFFNVESRRMDGTGAKVEFVDGKVTKKGLQPIKVHPGEHGLRTTFAPAEMMGPINVTSQEVESIDMLWGLAHVYPIGVCITYNSIEVDGSKRRVVIENQHGIAEILGTICHSPLIPPIHFSVDNGTRAFEFLLTYDTIDMNTEPTVLSFGNMCYTTPDSLHVKAFLESVSKFLRNYMNKIYLASSKKKLQVNQQDTRTGLKAVVLCKSLHPLFEGQAKTRYSEVEMEPFAAEMTLAGLEDWSKKNPAQLEKLCKYLKDVCEIRTSQDKEKIKISDKYTSSSVTGYPAKYKKHNGKGPFELIICEGDSACGAIQNDRLKENQGVFPIRGKFPNACVKSIKEMFDNAEVCAIVQLCGYKGYSKHYDPAAFKPSRIIIMTDADPDGAHITCLLLIFFLRYMPFVIEQGKLFVATPPLYGLDLGKNKLKFFVNNREYVEYVQNLFCQNNTIADIDTKKPLTKTAIVQLLYNNIDYIKYLTHVSNIFSINPQFLEFLLYCRNMSFAKFKSAVEKAYIYTKVTSENKVTMIHGLVGNLYHTVFFDARLLHECQPIIDMIERDKPYYLLNNQKVTLYQLMSAFSDNEPRGNLTRYKGLGKHLAA